MVVALAVTSFFAFGVVGCGSDSTSEPEVPQPQYENGVKVIGDTFVEVSAAKGTVAKSVRTDAGYTTRTDAEWIRFISKGTAEAGGSHAIRMSIEENDTGIEREAEVYITVDGFTEVLLVTIKQLALGSKDPVITYMDERLKVEYLWLDEYNDKRPTFQWSLKYDDFLEKSLLSMTTNIEDGGRYEDGTRYIFSNISYLGSSPSGSTSPNPSAPATRAGDAEHGLGLMMSTFPIRIGSTNNVALPIEHVYAGSPAEKAGLKRGDWVIKYNGSEVTTSNYGNVWNQLFYGAPASATIVKRTAFSDATSTVTVNSGSYYPNPVAVYKVLDLKNYPDFADKKVGYLAYMGFEWEYRQELVDAFNYFKSQGITDLIIDLTPNGGGEVYTSNYLVSMILGEEYVGEFLGEMRRHPKNPEGNTMMYVTSQTDDQPTIHLPHLGLKKVYFLTTTNTASASEATIAGCMGLDVDVVVVGEEFTHGKNCGMDTQTLKIGNGWYYFAPITFRIYNAEGWNDYADGIRADINIETFYTEAGLDAGNLKDLVYYYFPIPLAPWDSVFYNGPLQAALADIVGKSAKTSDIFGINNATRAAELAPMGTRMEPIVDENAQRDMYVDKDRLALHK